MCNYCNFNKHKKNDISHNNSFYALWLHRPNKRDAETLMHEHYTITDQEGDAVAVVKYCPMCGRKLGE